MSSVSASVNSTLPGVIKSHEVQNALVSAVSKGSRQPLETALAKSFSTSLLPALEDSLKEVFKQVETTFRKGTDTYIEALQTRLQALEKQREDGKSQDGENILEEMQNLQVTLLRGMQQQSTATATVIGRMLARGTPVSSQASNVSAPPSPSAPGDDVYAEIARYMQAGEHAKALQKAVNVQNNALVMQVCSKAGVQGIFQGGQPLPQPLLVCLVQHLCLDLEPQSSTLDLKLQFLQEAVFALDDKHASFQQFAARLLQESLLKLKSANLSPKHQAAVTKLARAVELLLKA